MKRRRLMLLPAVLLLLGVAGCVDQPTPTDEGLRPHASLVPGANIKDVQLRYTPGLLRRGGIIGTGIEVGEAGEQAIVVYAVSPAEAAAAHIPARLEGFGVNVVVTGRIMATDVNNPTTRERPAPNGFSVGHYAITAGTIGARVAKGDQVFILSNNHVLANSNDGVVGDAIYQPGKYDGGTSADVIGTLYDFQPINMSITATNTMDAAIALVDAGDLVGATPTYAYGAPGTTVAEATLNMPVKKFGRTTGLTHGKVSELNVFVEVCYVVLYNFCFESAYFTGQLGISATSGSFSGGGDSGSLIVTDNAANSPVGLLFAGSTNRTIANPIGPVLDRFMVRIDPGTGSGGGDATPPVVAFSASCTAKGLCTFTDQSRDDESGVVARTWNFGNRKTSTAVSPSTTYSRAGDYTVTLTATNGAGLSAALSRVISCTKSGKNGLSCVLM